MTTALNPEQFDAVCDAQDEDPSLAELSANEAAALLAKQGHPLFKDWGAKPEPETKAAATAPSQAPAEPNLDEGDTPPDLDVGAPQELAEAAPVTAEIVRDEPQQTGMQRAAPREPVEGMETLDSHDFAIPQLRLKQSQTRDDDELGVDEVEDGHWFLSNDPEDNSEVREVVFLEIRPGRQFMLPYADEDARERVLVELGLDDLVPDDTKVVCSSVDRQVPNNPDGWPALAERCEDCPHSKWKKGSKGRKPPACSEIYRALVLDITDAETPASMFLKGSAIKPTKSLVTNLNLAARRKSLPICGFKVSTSSKKKKGAQGTYFVPRFARPEQLDDQDVETFRGMREQLLRSEGV